METLDLSLFTDVTADTEARQYRILDALTKAGSSFRSNKIYPQLAHLVETFRVLNGIRTKLDQLNGTFPTQITGINLEKMEIEEEVIFVDQADMGKVAEIIDWAMPLIRKRIDEGVAIFEYVDDQLEVENVGVVPEYQGEGYFFVPDNECKCLNLYMYELSIYQQSEDSYRSLKTEFIRTVDQKIFHRSPNAIKLDLIREYSDLPNPATYLFQTNLDLPYQPTIYPVVKRRLMRHLADC